MRASACSSERRSVASRLFRTRARRDQQHLFPTRKLLQSGCDSFLWVINNRFRDRGLFILDEPEAALSPTRQLALLARMRQLVTAGSQFIVSTHSPILMAYPGATILQLDREGLAPVRYQDTEHYAVTKSVLQDPDAMLRRLFAEMDP